MNTRERENTTCFLLGNAKYNGSATQIMCHEGIKTTRLLLGVAKYKEFTALQINSICHGCIKTTRLLLGVEKYKESKIK